MDTSLSVPPNHWKRSSQCVRFFHRTVFAYSTALHDGVAILFSCERDCLFDDWQVWVRILWLVFCRMPGCIESLCHTLNTNKREPPYNYATAAQHYFSLPIIVFLFRKVVTHELLGSTMKARGHLKGTEVLFIAFGFTHSMTRNIYLQLAKGRTCHNRYTRSVSLL